MRLTKEIKDNYYHIYYTNGEMSSGIVYINDKDFTNAAIKKLGQYEDIDDEPKHLEKVKKALEIVKEKGLDIREFRYCISVYEYNICKNIGCKELTQEEFNLLKEVLKYERL